MSFNEVVFEYCEVAFVRCIYLFSYQFLKLNATPELDLVEFGCLTYQPVVEPFDVSLKLRLKNAGFPIGNGEPWV